MRKQIIGLASGVALGLAAVLLLLAGVTEAAETQKGDVYALDTCPVLGTKLGSMEQAVKYDYKAGRSASAVRGAYPSSRRIRRNTSRRSMKPR